MAAGAIQEASMEARVSDDDDDDDDDELETKERQVREIERPAAVDKAMPDKNSMQMQYNIHRLQKAATAEN